MAQKWCVWCTVLLVWSSSLPAFGAFERVTSSSRSVAMGGASIAATNQIACTTSNPSLVACPTCCVLSLEYVPQIFGLSELSQSSVTCSIPTSIGAFAFSGTTFGFDLYREVTLTATYACHVGDELMVGVSLDWYHLSIRDYGSAATIGADVGLVATLTEQIHWGFSARNVNAPAIGGEDERLPRVFSTGFTYQPAAEVTIALDLVKDILYPTELHIGTEYSILELLDVRCGTSSDPSTYSAGVGVRYSFFRLDYAFSNHEDLGMTHQCALSIFLGEP